MKGDLRNAKGAVLVELALIFPLLFTMMGAVVSYGVQLSDYTLLAGAARDGARVASVVGASKPLPAVTDPCSAARDEVRHYLQEAGRDPASFLVQTAYVQLQDESTSAMFDAVRVAIKPASLPPLVMSAAALPIEGSATFLLGTASFDISSCSDAWLAVDGGPLNA